MTPPDDGIEIRYCRCADPENCTQPVPGYVCRPRSQAKPPDDGAGSETPKVDQCEDVDVVRVITAIVRQADENFQRSGGSSRHWVRECFLPELNRVGWKVSR